MTSPAPAHPPLGKSFVTSDGAATGGEATPSVSPSFSIDAVEALTNAAVGLVVSWAATLLVLGYSPAQSALITAMFFVLSFTRAWVLRAVFRRLGNG